MSVLEGIVKAANSGGLRQGTRVTMTSGGGGGAGAVDGGGLGVAVAGGGAGASRGSAEAMKTGTPRVAAASSR